MEHPHSLKQLKLTTTKIWSVDYLNVGAVGTIGEEIVVPMSSRLGIKFVRRAVRKDASLRLSVSKRVSLRT